MKPRKTPPDPTVQPEGRPEPGANDSAQPIPSPGSDPTNPYNQEAAGDWVANERASDRRNSEPGITDRERGRRKY